MTQIAMIDPDTVGQMVAEGLAIVNGASDGAAEADLKAWLQQEDKAGSALRPLRQLLPVARDLLEDASILNDVGKQLRVSVAHDALSGLLSCYGTDL